MMRVEVKVVELERRAATQQSANDWPGTGCGASPAEADEEQTVAMSKNWEGKKDGALLCYAMLCHGRWLHIPVEELLAPRLLVGTRRYPLADPGPPFAAAGH